ncbi:MULTISPECIES: acylneuraminate cytidylyltransferase [unclassified Leifsonia]|uniref:acylneuraminate cytidylyltransferase n=1 Tax=unclassified Leifsonia TaxID=2663824 RepID=UPI0009EAD006|nr:MULTISPECIES: acylneuraminate cytidylyltransferase [unclassified Leifsonia]
MTNTERARAGAVGRPSTAGAVGEGRVVDRVVAVIPARAGSRGLPGKNSTPVGGVPLIVRAVRAALAAPSIDRVVVTTDGDAIASLARDAGADIVQRPPSLAGDTATSESALLHALDSIESETGTVPQATVFIQATSPFIDAADLELAVRAVLDGDADVVFSAIESHAFLWRATPDGSGAVEGVNHSADVRLRRQDRDAEYRETGAFYVMSTAGFREAGHRFFGRIAVQLVPEASAVEIDSAADLAISTALARVIDQSPHPLIDVDAVVTDFDGVHTDDTASVDTLGRESVRVSRRDGHGVKRLREAGIPMLILSAETNSVVAARAEKLRVDVEHGVDDKATSLIAWAERVGVPLDRIAYLGNDVADLPCMRIVGWPVSVADADPSVIAAARVVLSRVGGAGAVRELSDAILAARGTREN